MVVGLLLILNENWMINTLIKIPGYHVSDEIYHSSRTLVYRGYRETDQQPVVIKFLKNSYPSFTELVQFRNQYTITKNLNSPLIIQTYSLETYQNGYGLVMEDFGGISLKEWIVQKETPLSLSEFFPIAIALCDSLDILYRNRIIHKDIKPTNILINPHTKKVKLIDFSIASLLLRETQTLINPDGLEGTLGYISPEQTGRMNRGIDYRSDFYSLGVTFYELLTGQLPFPSNDPMELVHCHIAKNPLPVHEIKPEIPLILSEIVSKLMAKNAEERYQSGLGIKFDLENCLAQLQENKQIQSFPIAQRDLSDRFIIPDKLYGREPEVTQLLSTFARVSTGSTEMMLVAGFSGIGKTVVVNEVHKPIVRQRGYFIKGKYDQFQANIPLSAFIRAFRDLISQLLTQSNVQIQDWKNKILRELGESGQVIIEVIPELEKIIGQQPPIPELAGTAAQNRFNLLFQKFTQVFTSEEHPLVMFLDDLQWADSASLKLMQLLMGTAKYFFLIGAYRDNEVNPAHPLMLTLSDIQKTEIRVNKITLSPLSQGQVNQLVADTLKCSEKLALPLAQLVYQKTQGNPFFGTQLLKALHQDNLIQFNFGLGCWQCDITAINQQILTDNVVEFMALQLEKLPLATQNVLTLAACIGNQFDLASLAIVSEKSEIETANDIWKALQEGLILPLSDVYKFYQGDRNHELTIEHNQLAKYKFLHDRVQQAAYSLIPDHQKQATHLKIGQLIQQNSTAIEQEEKIFDIVEHFNLGMELITQLEEREALAQLNLKAGQKARNSTAYTAANIYLQTGIELLIADCWQHQYELTLNLYVAATEVAYLNGDFHRMEEISTLVLQAAQTILDKIKIYEIQVIALIAQAKVLEAIAVARDALGQLGVELPTTTDETQISKARQTIINQQSGRQIEELINLPVMTDPSSEAAMELLAILFAPIFQGMPGLLPILSATMVSLSLQYGNAPASAVGYVIHGMILCNFFGEIETGYQFGKLALNLLDQFKVEKFKSQILIVFGGFIQHHQEALSATISTLKDGYLAGMKTGDFLNAGYNIVTYFQNNFFAGIPIDSWETELETYRAVMAQAKQSSAQIYLDINQQVVHNWRETWIQPDCLIGNAYDETLMLPKHNQDNEFTAIAIVYTYKLILAYFFGNYPAALDHSAQVKRHLMAISGLGFVPIFHFYTALTYLAIFPTQPEIEQAKIIIQVETHQTALQQLAQNAPMNHRPKWYLVAAEKHRVLDQKLAAMECYERAISLAKENKFINEEALANELTAKFYLEWGKEKFAQIYLTEAYYCYARWGAKAKVEDLEKRYSELLNPLLKQSQPSLNLDNKFVTVSSKTMNAKNVLDSLDLTTVLKASQALYSEIQLEKLLATLLQVVMENMGGDKCTLILVKNDNLTIVATADSRVANTPILSTLQPSLPVESSQEVPVSIINYVSRTQETLLIDDKIVQTSLSSDSYFHQQQPQSLLCTPIINQGKLIGILYLENHLTAGVFTSDRLQMIKVLTTQAAISLENAQLYHQLEEYSHTLEQKVEARTQEITEKATQLELTLAKLYSAQSQLIQAEKMSGLGQLVAGIAHEINNPINFIYGNLEPASQYINSLIELNNLYQKFYPQPFPEIEAKIVDIELEFLVDDLQKLLSSMKLGADRIRQIVLSLRNFSRLDEAEIKPVDIHDGIDSTLLILQQRLNSNRQNREIKIVKKYGKLPLINCYASALNQVFMNILSNAIDALGNHHQPSITIETEVQAPNVLIHITDNGSGISESIRNKIFEPFFTTKPIGSGTGLGLSISYSIIVEKHGGELTCISIPGKGTEFLIKIPL